MTILDLHRNPGHATPWYLLLRDDHGRREVETVAIRHGEDGAFIATECATIPEYMRESFDFTNYETLDELAEMFEEGLPREDDGAVIVKVTEPQYR